MGNLNIFCVDNNNNLRNSIEDERNEIIKTCYIYLKNLKQNKIKDHLKKLNKMLGITFSIHFFKFDNEIKKLDFVL